MCTHRDYSLGKLATNTNFLDKSEVGFAIFFSNVLEVTLSFTDRLEQSATSHEIVLVQL